MAGWDEQIVQVTNGVKVGIMIPHRDEYDFRQWRRKGVRPGPTDRLFSLLQVFGPAVPQPGGDFLLDRVREPGEACQRADGVVGGPAQGV